MVGSVEEVVVAERWQVVVGSRYVVPAAAVGVEMMVVVSEEMRFVYADLQKEVVEL